MYKTILFWVSICSAGLAFSLEKSVNVDLIEIIGDMTSISSSESCLEFSVDPITHELRRISSQQRR